MLLMLMKFPEEVMLSLSLLVSLLSPSLSPSVVVVEDIPERLVVATIRRLHVVPIESLANK
jgi:hypothetical protein